MAARQTSTPLIAALRRACADLETIGAGFALVGGLAVSARAEPRLTRDIDVAIAVEADAAAEAVVVRLVHAGYRVTSVVEQTAVGRLATIRLKSADPQIVVDLLFASCGIEREVVAAAERLEILPGLTIPVARIGHLIAMKLLSHDARERPQDADDLRALLAIATPADRRVTTTALAQITKRGYARKRDLLGSWRTFAARNKQSR